MRMGDSSRSDEHRCRGRRCACASGVDGRSTGIDYRAVTSLGHLMVVDSQNVDMYSALRPSQSPLSLVG